MPFWAPIGRNVARIVKCFKVSFYPFQRCANRALERTEMTRNNLFRVVKPSLDTTYRSIYQPPTHRLVGDNSCLRRLDVSLIRCAKTPYPLWPNAFRDQRKSSQSIYLSPANFGTSAFNVIGNRRCNVPLRCADVRYPLGCLRLSDGRNLCPGCGIASGFRRGVLRGCHECQSSRSMWA